MRKKYGLLWSGLQVIFFFFALQFIFDFVALVLINSLVKATIHMVNSVLFKLCVKPGDFKR